MRQLLLVAVLAALAASAITFAVCESMRPQAPAASPGLTAAEMKVVLADVVREVAALRREAAIARAAAPAADGPPAAVPSGTTVRSLADAAERAAASAPVVRTGLPSLPPAGTVATPLERFRQVLPRTEDGSRNTDARKAELRRWMFRSESDVFEWFGQPDEVNPEGETETWVYFVPTGERDADGQPLRKNFYISLNKGRLVSIGD